MKKYALFVCAGEGETKCDCILELINDCDCFNSPPTCCGVPMKLVEEKAADQGKEKHIPVITQVEGGYEVKVGDIPHPMIEKHYISFIELFTQDGVFRKFLKPDEEPVTFFATKDVVIGARAYCNIHGLWKS